MHTYPAPPTRPSPHTCPHLLCLGAPCSPASALPQACYGILKVPEGSWLCRTCALGVQPRCLLCPKKGGAMKPTRSGTKWVHVSCALWIPEVGAPVCDPQLCLCLSFGSGLWSPPSLISLSSLWSVLSWGLGHYPAVSRASFHYVYFGAALGCHAWPRAREGPGVPPAGACGGGPGTG